MFYKDVIKSWTLWYVLLCWCFLLNVYETRREHEYDLYEYDLIRISVRSHDNQLSHPTNSSNYKLAPYQLARLL